MNRKSILALFITLMMISSFVLPAFSVFGQTQTREKQSETDQKAARIAKSLRIVDRYREVGKQKNNRTSKGGETQLLAQKQERPEWAKEALQQSLGQLQQNKEKYRVQNAEAEFSLREVMKDGRGFRHVRLTKMHNGVEIFGGEQITHLDDKNVLLSVSGRRFKGVEIETTPVIDEARAIAAAKAALGHRGEFAEDPSVGLVILPEQIRTGDEKAEGATLVFKVDIRATRDGIPVVDESLFVRAVDGSIVWQLNNRPNEEGVGFTKYSSVVTLDTHYTGGVYMMEDVLRSNSRVVDANDDNDTFTDFTNENNYWGTLGDETNRQTVAADAHFGVAQSWDYFLNTHGRYGADGDGTRILSYVHYREDPAVSWRNASGGNNILTFGDGDGTNYGPFVSVDIVGHEFTHCVIDATAKLTYSNESGAVNESFCDIFGAAVGFRSEKDEDYLMGDDMVIPGSSGVPLRDFQNPNSIWMRMSDDTLFILPDHYADRYTGTDDIGGVHLNSSIMNHVYYLLAEGGTHRNGTYVPAIGRRIAEDIFYTVLVAFLTPSSEFRDVADAMVEVASIWGPDERMAVERAWFAVGVLPSLSDPLPTPDLTRGRIVFYSMLGDGLTTMVHNSGWMQWLRDYPGAFGRNWTHIINMGSELFYYKASDGSAAVGRIGADGTHYTTRSFPRNYFKTGWSSITWHEGYLFFYDKSTGLAQIGQITPTGYKTIRTYPAGNFSNNWTHIVSAQGFLLLYDQNSGIAVVGDWAYSPSPRWVDLHYYTLSPDWSHIIDGGIRSGAHTGILFYNRNNATYVVGDIDNAGNFTSREGGERWAYNFIRLAYTDVIRVGEGLLLYNENERKARVGYLLTSSECDRFQMEPFQMVKDLSEAYFPAYYTHIASHNF